MDEKDYLKDMSIIDYMNTIDLINMDVEVVPFEKLKEKHKEIVKELGEIEVKINYNKQPKYKFNKTAQSNIIIFKAKRKYFTKIREKIEKRIREGI